ADAVKHSRSHPARSGAPPTQAPTSIAATPTVFEAFPRVKTCWPNCCGPARPTAQTDCESAYVFVHEPLCQRGCPVNVGSRNAVLRYRSQALSIGCASLPSGTVHAYTRLAYSPFGDNSVTNTTWAKRVLLSLITFAGLFSVVPAPEAQTSQSGLDFPGSAAVASTMRFRFSDPENAGLPIYGPGGNGVTYIWRAYPRQQNGYYTAFFWGNDGEFWWDGGIPNTFYGAHPYPDVPGNLVGSTHKWEIAVEGNDFVNGVVVYNRWYTQAFRAWSDGSGKHHEFYWDLPNTDASHVVIRISSSGYGNKNPPSPALTWGDAPWNPGNEVWDGVLRGFQIYNSKLSLNDIQSEVNAPLSTSAGSASIWYL